MAELVQLGEEVSSNLQSLELVKQTGGILLGVVGGGTVSSGGDQPAVQAAKDVGKQSH